jgi:hypothetical protein
LAGWAAELILSHGTDILTFVPGTEETFEDLLDILGQQPDPDV